MPTPSGRTCAHALVHVDGHADLVQAERGHQPADAGPGDHRPERLALARSADLVDVDPHLVAPAFAGGHGQQVVHPRVGGATSVESLMWVRK